MLACCASAPCTRTAFTSATPIAPCCGAARALGLEGVIGTLQVGTEADFIVLNPKATPLLARKTGQAKNLEELLFALIVLGDDRLIDQVMVA